jgi:hypothetical protein
VNGHLIRFLSCAKRNSSCMAAALRVLRNGRERATQNQMH